MGQGRGAGGGRRQAAGAGGQAGRRPWQGAGASVDSQVRGRGGKVAWLWGGKGERLSQALGGPHAGGWPPQASSGGETFSAFGGHQSAAFGGEGPGAADAVGRDRAQLGGSRQPPSQAWDGAPYSCSFGPLLALPQRESRGVTICPWKVTGSWLLASAGADRSGPTAPGML